MVETPTTPPTHPPASTDPLRLPSLKRGVTHLLSEELLAKKLTQSAAANGASPLRIKFGIDPSSPTLHLGHAVVLKKLRQFQDLGHKVILVIGDFTATIGDPTGKSKTRPVLSLAQTQKNAASYQAQMLKVLDPDPAKLEWVRNSTWLGKLNFGELITLASQTTVARMLERNDFADRYHQQVPIGLHEFLYPLAQAYDSVAIRADVELGGTDQLFNLLVGRDIMSAYQLEPQVVMTVSLLVGLDGSEKMSKSLDNFIGLTEAPEVMFKKAMQVRDEQLLTYVELCTDLDLQAAQAAIDQDIHQAHRRLACELVRLYHGAEAVPEAQNRYDQVARKQIPDTLTERTLLAEELQADGTCLLVDLCVLAGFGTSKGEAKRLIQGKGIKLNGEVQSDPLHPVVLYQPVILQKGKNHFLRLLPPGGG